MNNAYLWLKAAHVLAVTIWLGAAVTVLFISIRLAHTPDRPSKLVLATICEFIGKSIIAPAGGLTFLLGIVAIVVGKAQMALWIWWGIAVAVPVLAAGGTLFRKNFTRLITVLQDPTGSEKEIAETVARLRMLNTVAIVAVASAVIVMVLKPA